MPIDPRLVLGIRQPEFNTPDPINTYGKIMGIQNAMQAGALQNVQLQHAQQAFMDDQATRKAYMDSGGDPDKIRQNLTGAGAYKALTDFDKTQFENAKARTGIEKDRGEILDKALARHRNAATGIDSPQAAAGWLQAAYRDPVIGPEYAKLGSFEDAVRSIPQDPAKLKDWANSATLGAAEYLKQNKPNIHMQDTGGASNVVAVPGLGGAPTVLSTTAKTQTPDSVAARETQVSEGAKNRNNSFAIAKMADARQREMNGIMEGQQGTDITPTATAIANHDLPMPNPPSGSRNPMAMTNYNKLLTKVKEINPSYNAIDYQVSQQAMKAFGTGKQGQEAQSANTAMNHIATLEELAKAQKNGDIQLFNKIANEFGAQTGKSAPTNLRAAITMVAPEITKAVVGAGGGVEDRAKSAAALNPNFGPDQFLGATGTMKELFAGRLGEAERTYERTTMRKDFRDKILSPAARELLDKRGKGAAAPPAAASPKGVDVSKLSNDELLRELNR